MTQPLAKKPAPAAPIAPRRPHSFTAHGITVTDDYAWLKDARWQEVLRDPAILDPDIRKYLEAETDYTEEFFATIEQCLTSDGVAGLQAICLPDDRWERGKHTKDFISRLKLGVVFTRRFHPPGNV